MTKRTRRNHAPAFKAKVALSALKARRRWPSWLSSSMSIRTRSRNGKGSFSRSGGRVWPGEGRGRCAGGGLEGSARKIGELTVENDFLEGALTKAGMLSAKR